MSTETTLFVVATTVGGFAREDASNASVTGLFTDELVAKKIASISHGKVFPIVLNHIAPGFIEHMKAFGIDTDQLLERLK